jgi:hypothetical protein
MKKTLIYTLGRHGYQESNQLEEANECVKMGHKVLYVSCDGSVGPCIQNPNWNKLTCIACVAEQKANNSKYLPAGVEQRFLEHYLTNQMGALADNIRLSYSTIDDIKRLKYKGVDIGYGAVSTYLSLTRNLNPKMNGRFKIYMDALLRMQILLTEIGEKIMYSFNPELVVLYNGRLASVKPILNLAEREGLNFICTENIVLKNNSIRKNHYYNETPHNISANTQKYFDLWDKSEYSFSEKENIARSFFERRRHALKTDDRSYTEAQELGLLPKDWDKSKRNFCIFNTSEDEFFSISEEFDRSNLFTNQLNGIRSITEKYAHDHSIHFYVRVHPNMSHITYKYHTSLYSLVANNVTVIPADSSVSSYTLIDACEKIIVFASTIGIEATYWGKPVISLSGTFYRDLDVVYYPKSKSELWGLIDEKNLKYKYNLNVLKYAFFYISGLHSDYEHVRYEYMNINLGIRKVRIHKKHNFFAFSVLHSIFLAFLLFLSKKLKLFSVFKDIPLEEE